MKRKESLDRERHKSPFEEKKVLNQKIEIKSQKIDENRQIFSNFKSNFNFRERNINKIQTKAPSTTRSKNELNKSKELQTSCRKLETPKKIISFNEAQKKKFIRSKSLYGINRGQDDPKQENFNVTQRNFQDKEKSRESFSSSRRGLTRSPVNTINKWNMKSLTCRGCGEDSSKFFNIPHCQDHNFCENCIKGNLCFNNCRDCANYYKFLTKPRKIDLKKCFFCDKTAFKLSYECESHAYCKKCYVFLKKNDFSHITDISECKQCSQVIKNTKLNDIQNQGKNVKFNSTIEMDQTGKKNEIDLKRKDRIDFNKKALSRTPSQKSDSISRLESPKKSVILKGENGTSHERSDFKQQVLNQAKPEIKSGNLIEESKAYMRKDNLREEKKLDQNLKPTINKNKPSPENQEKQLDFDNLIINRAIGNNPKSKNNSCCRDKSGKVFKTPRCCEHNYCRVCIVEGSRYIDCELCSMYFESRIRPNNSKNFQCSLCKLPPIVCDIKCESHKYCKYCYNFLKNNDYDHISNVANCEECNKSLKLLKIDDVSRPIENLVPHQNPNPQHIINKTPKMRSKMIKFTSNKPKPRPASQQKKKTICDSCKTYFDKCSINPNCNKHQCCTKCIQKGSKSFNCDTCIAYFERVENSKCLFCMKSLGKKLTTPRCNQHYYCKDCIKMKPADLKCDYCSMYFESLTRKYDPNILACSLCRIGPMTSGIKCSVHFYCSYCFKYLTENEFDHILLVVKCQDCSKSIQSIKDQTMGKIPL